MRAGHNCSSRNGRGSARRRAPRRVPHRRRRHRYWPQPAGSAGPGVVGAAAALQVENLTPPRRLPGEAPDNPYTGTYPAFSTVETVTVGAAARPSCQLNFRSAPQRSSAHSTATPRCSHAHILPGALRQLGCAKRAGHGARAAWRRGRLAADILLPQRQPRLRAAPAIGPAQHAQLRAQRKRVLRRDAEPAPAGRRARVLERLGVHPPV